MKTTFILISLFLLSLIPSSGAVSKNISKDPGKQSQCKLIARSDAINRAKSQLSGKVVGVQLDQSGKRSVYRVRILTAKKRVKTISIQACR